MPTLFGLLLGILFTQMPHRSYIMPSPYQVVRGVHVSFRL